MDSDSHSDIFPTPVSNKKANSPPMAAAGVKSKSKSKSKDTLRRPYYFRVCKRNKNSQIMDSLPDELLFHILLQLPAEDIPNAAMVCRKWYRTTRARDFVHAHRSHHSVSGLVIHELTTDRLNCHPPVFVSMRNGRFDVSNFVHQIRGFVWCSCNGLILEYDFVSPEHDLLITNPITNQRLVVPPFPPRISNHNMSGIAYSPASMEYKVVHTYYDEKDVFQCAVLTVGGGVDNDKSSWRLICTRHLSPTSKTLLLNEPIITLGFIHWAQADIHTHVLTLNVDTETMTKYTLPQSQGYERKPKFYFSAGKSLSLVVVVNDLYLEGWDMNSESGEWTKLYNIDFTPRKCEFERFHSDKYSHVPFALLPFGWIKFREVLAFHFSYPSSVCTAYNIVTREFHFFELGSDARYHEFVPHTINYLEWLST